ncbi:hypothetical protein PUN4_530113 [Paraburkholderia unamae]|nr:hypothetical protein PUN4_530113 [Paraburkholderia unamae]
MKLWVGALILWGSGPRIGAPSTTRLT